MKLVLATKYSPNYWQRRNALAPFANQLNDAVIENSYQQINAQCPMLGIGYYKNSNRPNGTTGFENFDYIKITGIKQNALHDYTVHYDFIQSSNTQSINLEHLLPPGLGYIFSIFQNDNQIIHILNQLGETFPVLPVQNIPTVQNVLQVNVVTPNIQQNNNWKDYIGRYFLELLTNNLGNNDFEDRVHELIVALGYDVKQKGHNVVGAYPDGIINLENNILIYDCKNSNNFYNDIQENRKMNDYINQERLVNPNFSIYGIFIAKSFTNNINRNNYFFYNTESLLYLLYTRLKSGRKFNEKNILRSINRNQDLSVDIINNDF